MNLSSFMILFLATLSCTASLEISMSQASGNFKKGEKVGGALHASLNLGPVQSLSMRAPVSYVDVSHGWPAKRKVKGKEAPVAGEEEGEKKEEGAAEGAAEGKSTEEEGERKEEGAAEGKGTEGLMATGLFASVVLISTTFMMTQSSDQQTADFTWQTLDKVVAIFMAVLWYQAVDDLVVDSGILDHKHHEVMCLAIYGFVILITVVLLSRAISSEKTTLAVFCGSAAHFVSFAWMHAASEFLSGAGRSGAAIAFLCLIGVVIVTAVTYVGIYQFKAMKGWVEDEEWLDQIDDVENDGGAMAVGIVWTMFVIFVLCGSMVDVEDPEENPAYKERTCMLIYGVLLTLLSGGVFTALGKLERPNSYILHRLRMFVTSFLAISVAWAFMFWGKAMLRAHAHEKGELLLHLHMAGIMSAVALVTIFILSKVQIRVVTPLIKREIGLVLSSLGLMVGWAWEECFDEAVEKCAGEDPHTSGKAKFGLAVLLGAFVLPAYVMYLKPKTVQITEEQEKADAD